MAYAAASDVAAYCRSLLGAAPNFSVSTSPMLKDVDNWLSSGCSVIETYLQSNGYKVPITQGQTLYPWLVDLNALYAAAQAELSRVTGTIAPGARSRGQVFDDMFWKSLGRVLGLDLTNAAGLDSTTVSSRTQPKLYAGGVSATEKETQWNNTDNVRPRFYRGQFTFRDQPGASSTS